MTTASFPAIVGPAQADPDVLPPEARAHNRRLASLPGELRALAAFFQNHRLDHIDAVQAAEREAARLRGAVPADPRLRQHVEERIEGLKAQAERARADAAEAEKRAAPLRERASQAAHLATSLSEFVAAARPGALRPARPVKVPAGATLESIRAEIADLGRQIESTRSAAFPRDRVLGQIAAEIDGIAQRGAPRIDARRPHAPARLADAVDPAGPFLVWLLADTIKARLAEMVGDLPGALTDAQRADRLADLARRRLDLERIEEQIVRTLEAEGRQIDRRADASAAAVLGVEVTGGAA